MAKQKQRGPTWSDVKNRVTSLDRKQLVQLAGDLYGLSKENKDFFHARFAVGEDPLAPYKRNHSGVHVPEHLP